LFGFFYFNLSLKSNNKIIGTPNIITVNKLFVNTCG